MTYPIMTSHPYNKNKATSAGFTLAELLVVLVIITTAVVMIVPYTTRHNRNQATSDGCQDIICTLRYAMSHATTSGKPTRMVIQCDQNSYRLEQASDVHARQFEALEGIPGSTRLFDNCLHISDVKGFELIRENTYALILNPLEPWPSANLIISSDEYSQQISVQGNEIVSFKLN